MARAVTLRRNPDYARARAGLCQALVQESVISNDAAALADADEECARADELAPQLPAVRRARAALARRNGRHDAADAYARATEIAERALPTRGHSPNVRAHLAYYYTVLGLLDAQRVPRSISEKLPGGLADLSTSATDPQAFIRIASAWALLGRTEEARAAYAQGTADCAGFGASPDLDALRPQK